MFEIRDLQVIQGGKTLWDGLSFRLNAGERLGISAPSGFGKTTLGRVLAQWQQPHAGGTAARRQTATESRLLSGTAGTAAS